MGSSFLLTFLFVFVYVIVASVAIVDQSAVYSFDGNDIRSLLAFKARILKDPNATLSNWNPKDNNPCNWTGVSCASGTYTVNRLNISHRNLSGHLGAELGRLTRLQYLNISGNAFVGGIPAELGRLKDLMVLDLSSNQLESHIPTELGKCLALKVLNISYNNLTGSIPAELGELENLQEIYLSENNLTGGIPEELGKLNQLRFLHIANNDYLSGHIPSALGRLSSLSTLHLASDQLTGRIPTELGQLRNLTQLWLGNNKLNGSIPSELRHLKLLRDLYLHNNSLSGEIPPELSQLSALEYLFLGRNNLSGHIPPDLGRISTLRCLHLPYNGLIGHIPPDLGQLKNLEYLDLSQNSLTGYIPSDCLNASFPKCWGQTKKLRILLLRDNRLGGSLPAWIWRLSKLQVLDLSNNLFTAHIPGEISELESLKETGEVLLNLSDYFVNHDWSRYLIWSFKGHEQDFPRLYRKQGFLDFSNNQLSGEIPTQLGLLQGVRGLNLSSNKLVGRIPPSLGNISNLESLDLSNNSLDGLIPEQLEQIKFLAIINLSYNNLSGPIPSGGQFNTFENSSYMGNINLCGAPLSKLCKAVNPTVNTTYQLSFGKSSDQKKMRLIVIIIAIVAILFFFILSLIFWFYWRRHTISSDMVIYSFENGLQVHATDLYNSTNGYSNGNIIGATTSSTVYKGALANGQLIAIKKLKTAEWTPEAECRFVTECKTLGKIRHRNLVKILGAISSSNTKILVLQFMPNGSLDMHLHNPEICLLTWETRLKIALGVAQAIVYLHEDSGIGQIVHCDLKPSNILLDQDFEAHVSDFGIARLIDSELSGITPSTTLRGSVGYMAPEFAYGQNVSPKADVYSYGVVLLEMLTGKTPIDSAFGGQNSLAEWVRSLFPERAMEVVDVALKANTRVATLHQIYLVIELALFCTQPAPNDRPSMNRVLEILEDIKGSKYQASTNIYRKCISRAIFEDVGGVCI